MAFLENLERFYGTGECNSSGKTLEEFLDAYDPKRYDCPSNTTDIIVVRSKEPLICWGQPLEVLLVKRSNHPSIGMWATPGGFVEMRENLYEGAARELEEETGVKGLPLVQLQTWGDYDRDPRWRVITTSFLALVEGDVPVKAGDDAADALWFAVELAQEQETVPGATETEIQDINEKKATERNCPGCGKRETDIDANHEVWNLRLRNPETGTQAKAKVKITHSGHRLLKQEKYELLECENLAVDHGCLITQALLYLKNIALARYHHYKDDIKHRL